MRNYIVKRLSCLLLLFLFCLYSKSQNISTQKGLTTVTFTLAKGKIKAYLPNDIRPGETISGSIVAEAVGKNARQIENNLSALKKYFINIQNEKYPVDSYMSFQFMVAQDKPMTGVIQLITLSGVIENEVALPTTSWQDLQPAPSQCIIPTHALTASPLTITGPFDGDASNTKCSLNNKPLEILAESPRQCVVLYPADAKGLQNVYIQEKNQPSCIQNISTVQMNISAGKLSLLKGERTYINVSISGLQNLPDTAVLTLDNVTTNVVNMQPMNHVIILLIPDSVKSGILNRRFNIQSIKSGDFTVTVNLDLPDNRSAVYSFDLSELKNESGYQGSYGYIGDQPCEPEGKTITWRWHKTFKCEIDDRKILMCGHTKEGDDVLEKLKKLLKELEMDKASDISEKMAKAFSTAKTFSYSIHVIRKWVDYDIYYKCVNGKWQPYGGVYINIGTDDLGWHSVKHPTTVCWMTFDSPAAEKEFETALEDALRAACK